MKMKLSGMMLYYVTWGLCELSCGGAWDLLG